MKYHLNGQSWRQNGLLDKIESRLHQQHFSIDDGSGAEYNTVDSYGK
jgi:hypothetical protein